MARPKAAAVFRERGALDFAVLTRTSFRLATIAALLAIAPVLFASQPAAPRLVVVSWDAGGDWIVDRLLAEGRLPNVAALAARGARAESVVPAFPSKTAVGHAAIFTGAWPDRNGISGNQVPVPGGTVLDVRSGYDARSLTAEPLWVTAAKAGRRVAVLSATQSFPPEPALEQAARAGVPDGTLLTFSGFESRIARAAGHAAGELTAPGRGWSHLPRHRGASRELAFSVGETPFFALLFDDPADPVKGLDSVLIRQGSRKAGAPQAVVKPRPAGEKLGAWSPRFRAAKGELGGLVTFRLFELAPDGGRLLLYQRAVNGLRGAAPAPLRDEYLAAYGGFHDDGFDAYEGGELGPRLWEGGDGEAERRVTEIVRLDCDMLARGTRFALERLAPDVLLHYSPAADSAGHVWMGLLDPASPAHDPVLAARLWPHFAAIYDLLDGWLGEVVRAAGDNAVVALVSDHGMAGVTRIFHPNAVLARAGLLTLDASGAPDLARTRVISPRWGAFTLAVNGTDRPGGVVEPAEREGVLRQASEALLAARDPGTGAPVVTAVFRPDQLSALGLDGPAGGDLCYELAPGYYEDDRGFDAIVTPDRSRIGSGQHGYFPFRTTMQAIWFLAGPGVKSGVTIPAVRQVEIAPTLLRLVGIAPPAGIEGHVVGEIFADAR